MILRISLFLILIFTSGCFVFNNPTEPAPKIVVPEEISYNSGMKNSGIYATTVNTLGFLVSDNFIKRYNILVDYYTPYINLFDNKIMKDNYKPIKLTNWLYYIDNQHMSYFLYLNLLHKQEIYKIYGKAKEN